MFNEIVDEVYIEPQDGIESDGIEGVFDKWLDMDGVTNNFDSFIVYPDGKLYLVADATKKCEPMFYKVTCVAILRDADTGAVWEAKFNDGVLKKITKE